LVIIKSLLSREEYHHQEFCREIEMFSKLTHEHIAKVLGVCCDMEPRFLITEYSDWVSIVKLASFIVIVYVAVYLI